MTIWGRGATGSHSSGYLHSLEPTRPTSDNATNVIARLDLRRWNFNTQHIVESPTLLADSGQLLILHRVTSSMHHQDDHHRRSRVDGGARYRIHAEVQRGHQHHLDLRAFLQSLSRCTALAAFIGWSVLCGQLRLRHRRSTKARAGLRRTLRSLPPGNPPHPQPIHFSERGPRRPSGAVEGSQEFSRRLHVFQYEKAEPVLSNDFQFESLPECTDLPKQTKESYRRMWGKAFSSGSKAGVRIQHRGTAFRPRLIARCPQPRDDRSRSDHRSTGESRLTCSSSIQNRYVVSDHNT